MITIGLKRFYDTYAVFKAELDSGAIPVKAICYIKDVKKIYTHGVEFGGGDVFGDIIPLRTFEQYDSEIWDTLPDLNITEQDTVSTAIAKLRKAMLNSEETLAAMGVDLDKRLQDPLPVNTVLTAPASIGNPFGSKWMKCNGSRVYASDYPDLLLPADGQGIITLPTITDTNLSYYIKVSK